MMALTTTTKMGRAGELASSPVVRGGGLIQLYLDDQS
jgi:hypothetical protein